MRTGMKILFINNKAHRCGVADYGRRVFDILRKWGMDITYALNDVGYEGYDIILYNYHYATMPDVKKLPIKQVALFHEAHITFDFDLLINIAELPRPLFENLDLPNVVNEKPVIGSFGFGFPDKNFPGLCELVKQQYDKALVRLNIPFAEFGDNDGTLARQEVQKCMQVLNGSGIDLEFNHNFLCEYDLLCWLNCNDVNLFNYSQSSGRGLSSTIDYAVSVNKPVGVSSSEMFRHLPEDVCIDNILIKDLSVASLTEFKKQNSNFKLVKVITNNVITLYYANEARR